MDFTKYKTDMERADIAPDVPVQCYPMLMQWADEATDHECKETLNHYAWDAFHIETM